MITNNPAYELVINRHIEHLLREYDAHSNEGTSSQLWFLTFTFPTSTNTPPSAQSCFARVERWYVRLLPRLMSNFDRKRHLHPLMYLYADDPLTKSKKPYASLPLTQKFAANQFRTSLAHPETALHIHAVMVVPAALVTRFASTRPFFESMFRSLSSSNSTLHALRFEKADMRNVMFYASKLLAQPQSVLKQFAKLSFQTPSRRGELPTNIALNDLHVVLPKARSEPAYVYKEHRWERKFAKAIIEAQRFRKMKPAKIRSFPLGTLFRRCESGGSIERNESLTPSRKRNHKPVLLNLPTRLLEQVDEVVNEQSVSRTHFMRQAIERNLNHYQEIERPARARLFSCVRERKRG